MKKPSKAKKAMKSSPRKTPPMMESDTQMKDMAFERNFTKDGKPRLAAQSGEGSMGQRR